MAPGIYETGYRATQLHLGGSRRRQDRPRDGLQNNPQAESTISY
jgi:hypothetical protein